MPTPISQVIVEDRYDQITALLTAARVSAETHTALACWQIALTIMYREGIPLEVIQEWTAGWWKIRQENEKLRQQETDQNITEFMNAVINNQKKDS